jgi:hypothetical protein
MKKLIVIFTILSTLALAGGCRNVTITDDKGYVHTVLVCD